MEPRLTNEGPKMDFDVLIGLRQSLMEEHAFSVPPTCSSPRMGMIQRQLRGVLDLTLMGRYITNEKLKLTFADLIGS